jgi:hypothetical protein
MSIAERSVGSKRTFYANCALHERLLVFKPCSCSVFSIEVIYSRNAITNYLNTPLIVRAIYGNRNDFCWNGGKYRHR